MQGPSPIDSTSANVRTSFESDGLGHHLNRERVADGTRCRRWQNYFFLAFFSAFLSALRSFSCAVRSSLRRRFMRRRSSPPSPSNFKSAEVSASSSGPSTPRAAKALACRSSPSPNPLTHCHTCNNKL